MRLSKKKKKNFIYMTAVILFKLYQKTNNLVALLLGFHVKKTNVQIPFITKWFDSSHIPYLYSVRLHRI